MTWTISKIIALIVFICCLVLIVMTLAGVNVAVVGVLVLALIGALALAMLIP